MARRWGYRVLPALGGRKLINSEVLVGLNSQHSVCDLLLLAGGGICHLHRTINK